MISEVAQHYLIDVQLQENIEKGAERHYFYLGLLHNCGETFYTY